ncbi:MAG: low molecular weight phosphatase family protein, partial [Pseudomonadota bacterium]
MSEKPGSVLFCCSRNAIRSPMAEGICKRLIGTTIYIDSAGLHPQSEPDGFMITCMDELGINMRNHHCKSFEQLYDISFDIVIAMSEAAYSRAKELTRMMASTV